MCGICGFIGRENDFCNKEKAYQQITNMTNSLIHRGPDGMGVWLDMDKKIALGHRRLSIIDLSDNAKQPMISHSGRYIITFNGEIYNYVELQKRIDKKSIKWRSKSDTEVLLTLIDLYGVEKTLTKIVGMFGFAVYDTQEQRLFLCRDRFGEKSVYYGFNNGRFVFASELKAMKALPFFSPIIDKQSIYLFLKYRYIKSPWSVFEGIKKILPGHFITLDLRSKEITDAEYYSLAKIVAQSEANVTDCTLKESADRLEEILTTVISRQLRSDVPVGLFMSSGIDSALTSTIAQKVCGGKLKTYSIGVDDKALNEAEISKKYAHCLGTEHHEHYLNEEECFDILLKLPNIYDEPFSQASAIPTYYVSKMARQDVTVAISGDGGDEMFCGYIRDVKNPPTYRYMLSSVEHKKFDDVFDFLQYRNFVIAGFYDGLFCFEPSSERAYKHFGSSKIKHPLNQALHFEAVTFMESETLVKVDRAAMANSLEVREPFLDPAVAEFAFALPEQYKFYRGETKVILKELLSRYLPRNLFDIPKRGFWIPIDKYILSGGHRLREVREWAWSDAVLKKSGFFNMEAIKQRLAAERNNRYGMTIGYSVLVLNLWLKDNGFL